jgi:hypothetical protein
VFFSDSAPAVGGLSPHSTAFIRSVAAFYPGIRPTTTGGGIASRAMRSRIAANKFRVTATSASWNVTYFECRVTFAPVLMSFSRSVVSDQCRTGFGNASRRRKLPRL